MLVLAFTLALASIAILNKYSYALGIVDKPNHRKVHVKPIPVIGGICIVASVFVAVFFSNIGRSFLLQHPIILIGSMLLFVVGVWDDLKNISPTLRLLIQFVCVGAAAASGVRLTSLYGLFGIEEINLFWQYAITIVIIVGVTNAFNLLDGIDGLAGGLAFINISVLAGISFCLHQYSLFVLLITILGALAGFLKNNIYPAKIFMGDAGSLLLGFLTASVGILLIEKGRVGHTEHLSYIVTLIASILIIPVFDSLRVYLMRMQKGNSPFSADKSHIHHLLLGFDINHKKAAFAIYLIELVILVFGTALHQIVGISLCLLGLAILFLVLCQILLVNKGVKKWAEILKNMEKQVEI